MKRVDKVTVLGPVTSARSSYDVALVGPPGPRGLKGDPGPPGEPGGSGVSSVFGSAGAVVSVDYVTLRCVEDNTYHRLTVVVDGGKHVLQLEEQ